MGFFFYFFFFYLKEVPCQWCSNSLSACLHFISKNDCGIILCKKSQVGTVQVYWEFSKVKGKKTFEKKIQHFLYFSLFPNPHKEGKLTLSFLSLLKATESDSHVLFMTYGLPLTSKYQIFKMVVYNAVLWRNLFR